MGGFGYGVWGKTRGLRNNNPGNIKKTSDMWLGLSANQTDDTFFQFKSATYGIRAIMVLLRNYFNKYGLNTIRAIIGRWAPTLENDTNAYTYFVANKLDMNNDETIWQIEPILIDFTKAIVKYENGIDPYPDSVYQEAYNMINTA